MNSQEKRLGASFVLPNGWKERLINSTGSLPCLFLAVDISIPCLFLVDDMVIRELYPVSVSKYGIGNIKESFKTPTGIHRVFGKFGDGAPHLRLFKDRIDTGVNWNPSLPDENVIVTRIFWLEGLENGINRGGDVDTLERYIYIHGTNKEERIGEPLSHGCILMRNKDIVQLYNVIPEGTIVVIF